MQPAASKAVRQLARHGGLLRLGPDERLFQLRGGQWELIARGAGEVSIEVRDRTALRDSVH